jgi:exopolyphosphatase / guanosine-5'-triphosphate,3'-diphosphate pyrophosphatase
MPTAATLPPDHESFRHMGKYGVIDLGSNTIRLIVYEVKNDKLEEYSSKCYKRIVNEKEMAGLAAFTKDGSFTEAGVDRAASVLKTLAKHAGYFNCEKLDVFATAVIRNASNRDDIVAELSRSTELPITVLSERDEAHLSFCGALSGKAMQNGTLIDIGGGSTELSRISGGKDFDDISIGQGSLSSFAACVSGVIPTSDEMDSIAKSFRERLNSIDNLGKYRTDVLYGVGGSARAATKITAQLHGSETKSRQVSADDIRQVLNTCREGNPAFAHAALKASAERVHTMIPGCIIINELMSALGASRLEVCKYGVREGYLIERVLKAKATPPKTAKP